MNPTLAARVRDQTGFPWSRARKLCLDGRVSVDGERCVDPAARVSPDAVISINEKGPKLESGPLSRNAIVHVDRDIVVVDKPAGMLSVADEAGNKDTLAHHLRTLLRKIGAPGGDAALSVVHRLDRDTSGLMVFARNANAKRVLAAAFRAHDVERIYHAIAHGVVPETRVESDLVLDRGDGLRGTLPPPRRMSPPQGMSQSMSPPRRRGSKVTGKHSVTYIKPLAALSGATLVECRLETGRQHQIRIHLAELGHPLLGERVYIRDYSGKKIEAPRVMLHARVLGFVHPRSGERVRFERDSPGDFGAIAALTAR